MGVAPDVSDFTAELHGYAYLPRMFDKARGKLAGTTEGPQFGCPLDHTAMARLGIYPEQVLDLVRVHGEDDTAILDGLKEIGIASAEEAWFDAEATEDELLGGPYLKVRPVEQIDELRARPGHEVLVVEEGEAKITLGERQMRIVRAGEAVRIPPELPHRIEGSDPLRISRQ